ncbi:MAG TPA: BON domain-containing protein [Ktedonobacterales bacterium]
MHRSEHARVFLQPGKLLDSERIPAIPPNYRERVGNNAEIEHLWLWPQTAQMTLGLKVRTGLFSRHAEMVPLSAGAPLSPKTAGGAVELLAKMPVFCSDEHQQKKRYRVGHLEGMTVAARTGLANGLVVRVRSHPEEEVQHPSDPLGHLISVAGRRLVLPPNWALAESGPAALALSGFPAQVASGSEYVDDLQVSQRLWAILNENPALQPFLGKLKVVVQDGVVYLGGQLPQSRLRNSAKQDIWHVPGVVAIEDTLRIEGE